MAQQINDNFQVLAALPIDDRNRKPTIAERDAISSTRRFTGLQCFVDQTQTLYQLQNGILNSNWVGIAGLNVANNLETVIEGFYVLSAGKTTPLDWEVGDKFRGWIGSRYVVGEILTLPVSLPSDIDDASKVDLAIDSDSFISNTDFVLKITIAQIRALSGTLSNPNFYTTDLGQEGNWYYDATDTTSTDNTGTILVTSDGKRIKRIFDNTILPEWFGAIGDGTNNDGTAIQNAINASSRGNSIVFNTTKTYISSALNLKSGVSLIGNSISGMDHTQVRPKLKYSGTTGDFLTLVSGASSPYTPTEGLGIKNMSIDGNATTGSLMKLGAFRVDIQGNNLFNASKVIYYPNTTGWIGENRITGNNIYNFTDAIYGEGLESLDGHIQDNFIYTGTRGIYFANSAGWDIHGNHLYGITGTNIDVSGSLFMIRNNLFDNIDTIGVKATVNSVVSGSLIQNNMFTNIATSNSVCIDVVANSTGKILISGNSGYVATALTGTIGVRTTGSSTFFGSIIYNLFDQLDTPYSLHSANTTDLLEIRNQRILSNVSEFRFEHNGNATWKNSLMSQGLAPETVYSANVGSIGINSAGGVGTLWVKLTGTGNTGWEQVFSGKATPSKTGSISLAGDLSGTADTPLVTKIGTSLSTSAGGYELLSKNTTTGVIEKITSGFYSKTDNPVFTTKITTPEVLINGTPTTSAGTYDILTRNTSTGVVEKIASSSLPVLSSGSYSPTFTAVANSSSVSGSASYIRNGNIITVTIRFSLSETAANTLTTIRATLPINKTGSASNAIVGSGAVSDLGTVGDKSCLVNFDASTSLITINYRSSAAYGNVSGSASFQYDITE